MRFLSYYLQYYDRALREFENAPATAARVYLAKQLLKFAEDIADEGYPALSDSLESTYGEITEKSEKEIGEMLSRLPPGQVLFDNDSNTCYT